MGELLLYEIAGQVEGLRGRARMAVSLTRGEKTSPTPAQRLLFVMVPGGPSAKTITGISQGSTSIASFDFFPGRGATLQRSIPWEPARVCAS